MAVRKAAAPLRAVKPDEKAAPKSVTQAASKGTQRELLAAMRDRIAATVEDPKCPPRDLASLSLRLTQIVKDIEALDLAAEQEAAQGGTTEDEAFDADAL